MRTSVIKLQGMLTKDQVTSAIKKIRDHVNDYDGDAAWPNQVCHHLDAATDVVEFPTASQAEFKSRAAERDVVEWFDSLIQAHRQTVDTLVSRRDQFVSAMNEQRGSGNTSSVKPSDVLSWGVNDVQNGQRNMRLDLAVSLGAKLGKLS